MPGELVQAALLTGSTTASRRADLLGKLASGELKLLVGTHALIEEAVSFDRLAVAVVDEQHRFGVNQRRALDRKAPAGLAPHVLHMTATPIPRTLALTAYGDLDVTVLRELPAGRRPIDTHVASTERERARAYERIREELREGRQAFVVCPLVEESEALQARAATAEYERLARTEFKDFRVELLHGQLKSRDKQQAMAAFAAGGADVLVATTVIEVGIDVPNASVMLVEGAERYGISQLHQLRGRIGRGTHDSLCVLFGPKESARLRALAEHRDGFKLAEIDLELRGEGEMLGTRQSGLAQFRVARLPEDAPLLEAAREIGRRAARGRPGPRAARARAARAGRPRRVRRRRARSDPGLAAGGRLVQPEGRALVVAAQLEAAEAGDRVGVALDVDLLGRPAQLAHARDRGVEVLDREERVRRGAAVAAVHPAGPARSLEHPARAARARLEGPAEQGLVERASPRRVLHAQLDERQLARHGVLLPRVRSRGYGAPAGSSWTDGCSGSAASSATAPAPRRARAPAGSAPAARRRPAGPAR